MKKKAYQTVRNRFFLAGVVCLLFFLSSCGLDVYYILPAPYSVNHTPVYTGNYDESYFEFFTNENSFDSGGGLNFSGTEVYYRIYSSYSTMKGQVETLQSLASSDSTSATAATRLVNATSSSGYGYKPLRAQGYQKVSTLIPYTGENQRVYIRLSDYYSIENFSSRILVNSEYLYDSETKTIPIRNTSDATTFNFGRSGTYDASPKSGDDDVTYTSMSDGKKWYVAMFAVAIGFDVTYTPYYSNICYLGAITIDAASENN